MKRPTGWHFLVGLAAVLALWLAIGGSRQAVPPSDVGTVAIERPLFPPWQGTTMQIDPKDLARAGRERDDNGLEMKFCWCPPGTFRMGRVPVYLDDVVDGPVRVTLTQGFWMGKFEVTQAQWQEVMRTTMRDQRAKAIRQLEPARKKIPVRDHFGEGPDYPIYFTSHIDAEEFCRKLTEAERGAGRLESGWEYRLPTEAQWEFACRAGTTTATAFGDRLSSTQANFNGTMPIKDAPAGPFVDETVPVGRYPANGWGIHDMHGNVSEWCRDRYGPLRGGTDPFDGSPSPDRTYRGGCWYDPGAFCISTKRLDGDESRRGSGRGFRIALVPTGR